MGERSLKNELVEEAIESLVPESRFRRILLTGILLPIVMGCLLTAVMLWRTNLNVVVRETAARRQSELTLADKCKTALLDMETGERGYLLSGITDALSHYNDARNGLRPLLDQLVAQSSDNPEQLQIALRIRRDAQSWTSVCEARIAEHDAHVNLQPADYQADKAQFDHLRKDFDAYLSRGRSLLAEANGRAQSAFRSGIFTLVVGLGLLALLLGISIGSLLNALSRSYRDALRAYDRQRERAIEASNLYRLITENSGDLISLLDKDGRYTYVSPSYQTALGFKENELLGKNIADYVHPDDLPAMEIGWDQLMREGVARAVLRHQKSDGSYRWIEGTGTRVGDQAIGVGRDVSERIEAERRIRELNADLEQRVAERTGQLKTANENLETANKELEAFSYSVSHDLRAPLRSVASFSKILEDDLAGKLDEDSADNLSRIRQAAKKMSELIEALLNFSRIARAPVVRQEVDLSKMAVEIVSELRRVDPDRIVETDIEPGLTAFADPSLARLVVENLVENAWKFTANQDRACIRFGLTPGGRFFLEDNGVGFEQKYVDKIFLPFERLHTDREFHGTGIGLATTKRIIDRHLGSIEAESELGKGARFTFTFGEG